MAFRQISSNRGRSGRVLPNIEALEDRTCLSTLSLTNHVLTLTGDNNADTFTIKDAGNGNVTASIQGAGGTKSINATGVSSIVVNSGNGKDAINYSLTNTMTTARSIAVNLGSGQDTVNLDFSRGVSSTALTVNVKDGTGNDSVTAKFGAIHNTNLTVNATQGKAIDQFMASFNGAISGTARVSVNETGATGYDGTSVSLLSDIASTAQVNVNTVGGIHPGTTHVDYQGQLNGVLNISERAGSAGDYLESTVTLKTGGTGTLKDTLLGGAGNDLLTLHLNNQSTKMKSVTASMDGGGGSDNIGIATGKVTMTHIQRK
jgi:hypothetical protein